MTIWDFIWAPHTTLPRKPNDRSGIMTTHSKLFSALLASALAMPVSALAIDVKITKKIADLEQLSTARQEQRAFIGYV